MKKNISLFLLIFLSSVCYPQLFNRNNTDENKDVILIKDPYTLDDLEKMKADFYSEKAGSLEALINIYKDKNQILSVRLKALDIL